MLNMRADTITGQQPAGCSYPVGVFSCVLHTGCRLKVNGRGSVMVEPDKAVIVLGVTTENRQLEAAQRENAEKTSGVIRALTDLGVPREAIQTQTYQIQPQYDYIEGRQVFRGYSVVHNLRVETGNISMVGKITDAAVAAGANTVSGIEFSAAEPAKYYEAALNAAISDAVAKAVSVGVQLRVPVSQVPVEIIEAACQNGGPVPFTAMQATGAATPIQPGRIEITALIEAIFAYGCR